MDAVKRFEELKRKKEKLERDKLQAELEVRQAQTNLDSVMIEYRNLFGTDSLTEGAQKLEKAQKIAEAKLEELEAEFKKYDNL